MPMAPTAHSMDATFFLHPTELLDRGFVFAIAHIRGGEDLGETMVRKYGKLLKKKNTFTDFIDCSKHVIEQKHTSPRTSVCRRWFGRRIVDGSHREFGFGIVPRRHCPGSFCGCDDEQCWTKPYL